jgi:hypothetical protein
MKYQLIMLHVWGSLGSITLALLQQWDRTTLLRFLRYATILGGLASLSSNNVISSIVTHATKDTETLLWFFNFYRYNSVCVSTRVQTCIWLRTPLGWKIKFVSGNCERSTWVYTVDGEDIRSSGLVNGRLMMDYVPRCRCGVQADR